MKHSMNLVGALVCLLSIAGALANENDEDECCDFDDAELDSFMEGLSLGPFVDTQLAYIEKALPDIHSSITSGDWIRMDGPEKLQAAAKVTLVTFGVNDDEIKEYLDRIDLYESSLPDDSRAAVWTIFGMVGDALVDQVAHVQRVKADAEAIVDALYPFEESHPEEMDEFEKCLIDSIERTGIKSVLAFGDWLDRIEEKATSENLSMANARAYSDQQTQFKDAVLDDAPTDARVCFAQLDI